MRIVVQKYGGSSLGTMDRIRKIAAKVVDRHLHGDRVVVVASAIGNTTDELLGMAGEVGEKPRQRELALLLSTGEVVSSTLLAMAIQNLGYSATALTGEQIGISAHGCYANGRIKDIDPSRILKLLAQDEIVVLAGFQGRLGEDVAVLGRGGSDASAVAMAAALHAHDCQIYSDVAGVFTADPRIVPQARKLPAISYEEMIELAASGAQIMMGRAVEIARKYDISVTVGSSFDNTGGTVISRKENELEQLMITGISAHEDIAIVDVRGIDPQLCNAGIILRAITNEKINIKLLTSGSSARDKSYLSMVVASSDVHALAETLEALEEQGAIAGYEAKSNLAQLSVVGYGIAENHGVASDVFEALSIDGIDILLTSTSEIKISVIIQQAQMKAAIHNLHNKFNLAQIDTATKTESTARLVTA